MTITLQDVAYQPGLRIDDDPVSGCIGGWEQQHQGRTIEEFCEQLLGVVPGPDDRQSQTKWTMKLAWFQNTVCGELEQDASQVTLFPQLSMTSYIYQVGLQIRSGRRDSMGMIPLLVSPNDEPDEYINGMTRAERSFTRQANRRKSTSLILEVKKE
ncbi:uncharacterized protein DS421_3g89910 [Arachis hypogaea]|nr:uncharacterized protein DS421_3g89910 [Arachis hypogaea]